MANEPIAERPTVPEGFDTSKHGTMPWSWAVERLETARNYWLATVRPDGRPHQAPLWCIWLDGALYFSTDEHSRKARNFTRNPNCSISTDDANASVIIEGTIAVCDDFSLRQRVAAAYAGKYEITLTATETGIELEGGIKSPLYAITPRIAIGVTDEEESRMTRWRFQSK